MMPRQVLHRFAALRFAAFVALAGMLFQMLLGCGAVATAESHLHEVRPVPAAVEASSTEIRAEDSQARAARAILLTETPAAFLPRMADALPVLLTTVPESDGARTWQQINHTPIPAGTAGFYVPTAGGGPEIYLIGEQGTWIGHLIHHEWGHYLQIEHGTAAEIDAWEAAYEAAKARHSLPTDYAYDNAWEGWAECYAEVRLGHSIDPALRAVIDQVETRMEADQAAGISSLSSRVSSQGRPQSCLPLESH